MSVPSPSPPLSVVGTANGGSAKPSYDGQLLEVFKSMIAAKGQPSLPSHFTFLEVRMYLSVLSFYLCKDSLTCDSTVSFCMSVCVSNLAISLSCNCLYSLLCSSISLLCSSISLLCSSISLLCSSISLLCSSISLLCSSISLLCSSISLHVALSHCYVALSHYYVALSHYYVALSHYYVALSHCYVALSHYYVALSHCM